MPLKPPSYPKETQDRLYRNVLLMRELLAEFNAEKDLFSGVPSLAEKIERETELCLYVYGYHSIVKSFIDNSGIDIPALCEPWGWQLKEFVMSWGVRPAAGPKWQDAKVAKKKKGEVAML